MWLTCDRNGEAFVDGILSCIRIPWSATYGMIFDFVIGSGRKTILEDLNEYPKMSLDEIIQTSVPDSFSFKYFWFWKISCSFFCWDFGEKYPTLLILEIETSLIDHYIELYKFTYGKKMGSVLIFICSRYLLCLRLSPGLLMSIIVRENH